MHIILGGTGQVGSATARALLERSEPVTIVTRNEDHAKDLQALDALIAVADIRDAPILREVFRTGTRAFLLNPPADPSSDIDAEERQNVASIIEALEDSGLEKVVLASTYSARPGERCGDLTVLHEFEEKLRAQPIPVAINRGAYYMSNWGGMLDAVRSSGVLPSSFPADLALPTVVPKDLGDAAATRLLELIEIADLQHVEGPARYDPQDVANTYSIVLDKQVTVETIPREAWEQTFRQFGFSNEAAQSYACMTSAVVNQEIEAPEEPLRGNTTVEAYIRGVVNEGM